MDWRCDEDLEEIWALEQDEKFALSREGGQTNLHTQHTTGRVWRESLSTQCDYPQKYSGQP